MSKKIELKSPRLRVVIGDVELPDTWQEYEVQTMGRDQTRAESLLAKNKLGTAQQNPIKLADLTAWAALVRTGQIDLTWNQFLATYIEVTGGDDDEESGAVPTRPAPEAG
ncbi:MAG TPA: hypothetical protein VNN79_14285 [Actinomycetota bacterium]|nr:hypothetical protein [Actinomycetota bacterium]